MANLAIEKADWGQASSGEKTATIQGTAIKAIFLLAIMAVSSFYTWTEATKGYAQEFRTARQTAEDKEKVKIDIPSNVIGMAVAGSFLGFMVGMVCIFMPQTAPITAPLYAGLQGLAVGAVSAGFEAKYPGIVAQAVMGTFGIFACMLICFSTGIIKPSGGLLVALLACLVGIIVIYFANNILIACGAEEMEFVNGKSRMGIGFSIIVCVAASLCYIFDFQAIQEAAEDKAPKYMEWYGGFSLLVTTIWLYFEVLRLLAKGGGDSSSSSSD